MKHTIPKIYIKQILPLSILFAIALIIWLVGPYIAIGNAAPLLQPERRFYIITVFFMAWFIKFMFFDTAPNQIPPAPTLAPDVSKKIQTLQGRFQGAMEFLKKTIISKHGKNVTLSQLPWYLLIGSTGSGKTTLLANSNVNFILAKQFKAEKNISLSHHCDWWATRDSVLVDVPGTYISNKDKNSDPALWRSLLDLIKKNRRSQTLSGVVITLHLPELIKKQNQAHKKQIILEIKQRILQLREKFGPTLPFYLVITKCDLTPGFVEFFSDCGSDELTQAWGITIPSLRDNEKLADVFTHRFNALVKRLNKQLIWRMHQERNPNARPYIKDFPLQVERLKENIAHFLKALLIPDLHLQGVYLTSAMQSTHDESHSQMPATINPMASQALQLARQPSAPSRAFFVRQFILQGLMSSPEQVHLAVPKKEVWGRRAIYAVSASAIILSATFLGRDFQTSIQQAYSLQNDLSQYQLYIQQADQQENHLQRALPLLNALRTAAIHSNHSFSRFVNVLTFYSHKSQQTANTVYSQALQTIVLPEIKSDLEHYLQTSDKNSAQLYMALKAYLMLGDKEHIQADFIANTLKQVLPNTLNEQASNKLTEHLSSLLGDSWQALELDANLVAQARQQLTSMPAVELGFVILKNIGTHNVDSTLNLGTQTGNPPAFVSKQISNQIPNMFTASQFQTILSQDIVTAASETLQGNWVLGNASNAADQTAIASLTEQLRAQYITNYVDIWESLLANIQLFIPKNLTQMDALVANLTSSNSPLILLLQTIQQNTSFTPIISASPKIQSLNTLFASMNNTQQGALYPAFVSLRQLDFYLQTVLHTSEIGKSAFQAAKNHGLNPAGDPITQLHVIAEQSPEPLKNWLNTIATQSFDLLMKETSQYINNAWQTTVSTPYRTQLANRYPFNQNATQEVELPQFVSFMGQPGTLTSFYQNYLKPFVNETDKKWQWKTFDNQKLAFSDMALEQIQQATQVQRAFFPNGDNKLYVQFTLEPLGMDAHVKNFNLNINGQQITYQKERTPRLLSWPGPNNLHATTLNFISPNNQLASNVFKGDWGLFRLVTQSTKHIVSTKELMLDFNMDGHSAKYALYTQGHMNPFLPMNLTRFDLPVQLS